MSGFIISISLFTWIAESGRVGDRGHFESTIGCLSVSDLASLHLWRIHPHYFYTFLNDLSPFFCHKEVDGTSHRSLALPCPHLCFGAG